MINSVDHAFRLLASLAQADRPMSISDLSRMLELPRATLYRLVDTLIGHRVVVRDGNGYRLGLRLLELGAQAMSAGSLQNAALPFLVDLVRRTGETAHFAILDGEHAGYVAKVESPSPIRMSSHVGWQGPLHATAVGKAMLAHAGRELREKLLARPLARYTAHTLVDAESLAAELASVRRRGYAVDREELLEGLVCVAAAVRRRGQLLGALSVSGPASRMRAVTPIAGIVREAVHALAEAL